MLTCRVKITSPLESARDFSITRDYDVLITDIDASDFIKLHQELGVERLSHAESTGSFPAKGVVYGRNSRMFVPLVVSKRSTSVHVLFLYDTCSPSTYIRKDTMEVLGYKDAIPDDADVLIHGVRITVQLARGHFENVDLLGQDFMEKNEASVNLSYKEGVFEIHKSV